MAQILTQNAKSLDARQVPSGMTALLTENDLNSSSVIYLITIIIAMSLVIRWFFRNKYMRVFREREPLTPEAIQRLFESELKIEKVDVNLVLECISSGYGVKAGQLRPDDRFDEDLKRLNSWSIDGPEIVEDQLRSKINKNIDLSKVEIKTVGDLIVYIASITRNH